MLSPAIGVRAQAVGNEDSTGEACGLRVSKCQRVGEKELVSIKPVCAASAFRAESDGDQITAWSSYQKQGWPA